MATAVVGKMNSPTLGLVLTIALSFGGTAGAAGNLSPCKLPGVARAAKCGVVEVPENWDKPTGRKLSITVAVIAAEKPGANDDPIVPLMGGPGEAAIATAEYSVGQAKSLLRDRDLLLVDQRGAGKSAPLTCNTFDARNPQGSLRDLFTVALIERCEKELSSRADLTQYTYMHFARDLEHVRRTLGYGPLNLIGGSYGTRAAQFFLRAYPKSVRTVLLNSVVPLDVVTPLTMAKSAESARNQLFDGCAADPSCNAAFPELRKEFSEIAQQLEDGKAPIARGRFAEWLRSKLYRPYSSTDLPWIIHRAHGGDWSPITEIIEAGMAEIQSEYSFGLFFAITCNDDLAFLAEKEIGSETGGTFLGDYRVRQQLAACKYWPTVSPPTDRTPPKVSVPTLFVSGANDSASPLWFTQRVAPNFSERAEVVVVGHGHTEWNRCIADLWEQLVREGSVRSVRGKTCAAVPRPPFKTI